MRSIFNIGFILCLFIGLLFFNACKPDDETMRIERFEFLDRYSGNGVKSETNDLIDWAYIVHGYNEKKEKEIVELIDSMFCSQILPGLPIRIGQTYVTFYKASSNTNRENFNKGRIKH